MARETSVAFRVLEQRVRRENTESLSPFAREKKKNGSKHLFVSAAASLTDCLLPGDSLSLSFASGCVRQVHNSLTPDSLSSPRIHTLFPPPLLSRSV